jgi:hypothetical protein
MSPIAVEKFILMLGRIMRVKVHPSLRRVKIHPNRMRVNSHRFSYDGTYLLSKKMHLFTMLSHNYG